MGDPFLAVWHVGLYFSISPFQNKEIALLLVLDPHQRYPSPRRVTARQKDHPLFEIQKLDDAHKRVCMS